MRFSYYPGCSLEATAKEYDLSTREVCQALGVELVELEDWICCGATSAHSTNQKLGLTLPAYNVFLAQKKGLDVAVPCAACYNRLKKADYVMKNDEVKRHEIENMLGFNYEGKIQVYSLLEAMVKKVGIDFIGEKIKKPLKELKVVCYYGCLLVRPLEVTGYEQPENPETMDKLMAKLGAEVLPWSYKTECCGASLGLSNSEIVKGRVSKILSMAQEAGADAVVTACPLCQSNLEMRRKPEFKTPSFYFTELLGLALDLPGSQTWFKKHLVDPFHLLRSLSLAG